MGTWVLEGDRVRRWKEESVWSDGVLMERLEVEKEMEEEEVVSLKKRWRDKGPLMIGFMIQLNLESWERR